MTPSGPRRVSRVFTGSIRAKILAPVAIALILLSVTLAAYSSALASDEAELNLETKAKGISMLAAYAMGEAVAYKDLITVKPVIEGIRNDPDVSAIGVYDADGALMVGDSTAKRTVSLDDFVRLPVTETEDHLAVARPVFHTEHDDKGQEIVKRVGALWIDFSSQHAKSRAADARLRFAVIAVIGFVSTLLLLAWVVARLMRPIRELTRVATEIVNKGDLTQTIAVSSSDEIGQLAGAFRQLVEKLREIPKQLEETTRMLVSSVDSLGRSTAEQSQTVTRQAAAVQETQVTVQEIKQTSLLAAQKAEAVLKVAERADEIGRSGEVAISQSLGGLADIRAQVDEIARKIGELQERTRQIGLITETVKDLADQSNMLALNAAIEAVRSGEHGKGFAVVAREIRSLADQSIQATNRVRDILDDISNAIRAAVSITEKGAQKMEGGLVQMKMSGENLQELSSIVKDNAAAVRQIAAAVSQQNAGIAQIFAAVTDLNQMMDDTVSRLEHTGKSVEVLRDVSTQVSTVVTSFRV